MPPITVLKISKIIDGQTDVVGEFSTEEEAQTFVEAAMLAAENDGTVEDHEYIIEMPPQKL